MSENYDILEPSGTYHIFNRANGEEKLFLSEKNYSFFLRRYQKYIAPIADTFCYCLMPNHFHFAIRIKSEQILLTEAIKQHRAKPSKGSEPLEGYPNGRWISLQFSHLFNSYTQAFNKQQSRKGSLFKPNFKRRLVRSEDYLRKLVHYIHYNPVNAGLTNDPKDWRFSSFGAILSEKNTLVERQAILDLFEDKENFVFCHTESPEISGIE